MKTQHARLKRPLCKIIGFLFAFVLVPDSSALSARESSSVGELIAAGDEEWSLRAEGFSPDSQAPLKGINARRVQQAVENYEQALSLDSENIPLQLKLIEALYFQGYFAEIEITAKKALFNRALQVSHQSLDTLEELAKRQGTPFTTPLTELTPEEQAAAVHTISEAPKVYFWASITWGLWGMTFGNLASAREDVATKVRDYAQVVALIDPDFADAGGFRLLGRLHTQAPRVPFFTHWVNRKKGIELLRTAYTSSNKDPRNALFLAEALLEYQPKAREEALSLLEEVAKFVPDESYKVELSEHKLKAQQELEKQRLVH